ncbi:hypothetical protein [Salinibius halmophilus]|uniref:hypothetical protein n=1 Tax=Salinibius halmophilus TaxID=1853216 RepID=UPI000E671E96|nr:hypothetical protein [Salinibius halmophilus]
MGITKKSLAICTALTLSSTAMSSERSGFLLSFGAHGASTGAAATVSVPSIGFTETESLDSGFAIGTSFKIGGTFGRGKQNSVYYHAIGSYFDVEGSNSYAGIAGIGYTYYFQRRAGGAYIEATLGLGTLAETSDILAGDLESVSTGGGALFGGGYEFNKYFQVGGYISAISVSEEMYLGSGYYADLTASIVNLGIKAEAKL